MIPGVYLHLGGIAVCDSHPLNHDLMRAVLPFIELNLTDREAWHRLLSDDTRLAAYRAVHGNKPKPRPPLTLFGDAA